MKATVKEALTLEYMSSEEPGWEDGEKVFIVQERAWESISQGLAEYCLGIVTKAPIIHEQLRSYKRKPNIKASYCPLSNPIK